MRPSPGDNRLSLGLAVARFLDRLGAFRRPRRRGAGERSAYPGGAAADVARAAPWAGEVARLTLGVVLWEQLRRQGYLDVRSRLLPGLTYRVRVGRRVQLLWDPPPAAPRSRRPGGYLCINPTYALPAEVFAAHLYLYVRDREEEILRVGAPHPQDAAIDHVF